MHLEFNEKRNFFSWEELRVLSTSLGFPTHLFESCMPSDISRSNSVSTKTLTKFIVDRYFYHDLHFTINLKTGSYNSQVLNKAIVMLSRRFLSFSEIQSVRLAFETFENYDQKGMIIDQRTFLRTLKMCDRVISPQKLMHRVGHIKSAFLEKGRIQLFEFFDLLVICELFEMYKHTGDADTNVTNPTEKTWTNLYKVSNFDQLVIPQDKKIWTFLNQKYRAEELRHNLKPEWTSHKFQDNPVIADDFHMQVKLSNEEYSTLRKKIKNMGTQIKLAQGGNAKIIRPQTAPQHGKIKLQQTSQRSSTARSETDISNNKSQAKKKIRPMSSPPVISHESAIDCKEKIERLQFDLITEDLRWKTHLMQGLNEHLPNHEEVLRRMIKQTKAPRSHRYYRRQQPSKAAIARLSDNSPRVPSVHLKTCDALMHGASDNERILAIQLQATKKQPKKKSRPRVYRNTYKKSRSRNSVLLQELMHLYNYESSDEESPRRKKIVNKKSSQKICDTTSMIQPEEETEEESREIEHVMEETTVNQKESDVFEKVIKIEKPMDKKNEILELLSKNFQKIYLNTDTEIVNDESLFAPEKPKPITYYLSPKNACTNTELCRVKSITFTSSSQTEKMSELERYFRDPKNLRISDSIEFDPTKVNAVNKEFEQKRRRVLKRIDTRYKHMSKETTM